jgi:hypothetical protein
MGANDNRFLIEILRDISALPEDRMIDALRHAGNDVWVILYLAYGDHVELALPKVAPWRVDRITHRSFVEGYLEHVNAQTAAGDLLSSETRKMVRLYVRGAHPTLTDKRRLELWIETLQRLNDEEIELLESIRVHRKLPEGLDRITESVVRTALPGLLETPVPQERHAVEYQTTPGILSPIPGELDPSQVVEVRTAEQPSRPAAELPALHEQASNAAKRRYDEVYSWMRFG